MNKVINLTLSFFLLSFFSNFSFAQWTSGGTQLSNGNFKFHRPMISSDNNGGAYITYTGADANDSGSVFIDKIDLNGNHTFKSQSPVQVTNKGSCNAPVIITCEDGSAIVAWHAVISPSKQYFIYAQKFDFQGNPLWNNGNPVQVSSGADFIDKYPYIISDKQNGCFISWTRYDMALSANSPDVFLQHINKDGYIASGWDAAGSPVASASNVREYYPHMFLSTDAASVFVMYNVGNASDPSGVSLKLRKINASDGKASASWNTAELILSQGPNVNPTLSINQYMFINSENYLTIFWLDNQHGSLNWEVYMQKINQADGSKIFSANGKCIAADTYEGTAYLSVAQNLNKDFLLAFMDFNVAIDVDAVKLSSEGTTLWSKIPLTTNHHSTYPVVVSDGSDGMYVFFQNTENNPALLYAIGINVNGNILQGFPENGTIMGAIGKYDFFPNFDFSVVAGVLKNAIAVWDYSPQSAFNIFACNINADGKSCSEIEISVPENQNTDNIEIFPNPFNDYINITTKLQTANSELFFRLFDITGKLIFRKQIYNSANLQFNKSTIPNGLYFYNIINQNTTLKHGILIKQ